MSEISSSVVTIPTELAEPAPCWYVVWTRSSWERLVEEQLGTLGFTSFLPTMQRWVRRKGVRQRVTQPMFPGYFFIHRRMDKSSYLALQKAVGIIKILGEGWDRLAVVPDAQIEALHRLQASGLSAVPHPYLQAGQRVRIAAGALAGIEGLCLRFREKKDLLVLSVDLLQRSVAVEVDSSLVVPV
jgi:transcription antitermination factor NusG